MSIFNINLKKKLIEKISEISFLIVFFHYYLPLYTLFHIHSPSPHTVSMSMRSLLFSLLLNLSTLPTHSPRAVSLFSISVSSVIFCLLADFVDQVPVKGEIIWYSSFTAWPISLRNALQFHPCCHNGQELLLSFGCIEFHCVNIPQFLHPLIY